MHLRKRTAGLAAGTAAMVAAAVLGTALPAQAYDPDPTYTSIGRDTDSCPCSGGNLTDPFDGTYFKYDAGGYARKVELYKGDWFIGKVEFHPSGEKLWIYDTKNDGDTFYVRMWVDNHDGHGNTGWGTWAAPGTSAVMDYRTVDLRNVAEGATVKMGLYDDAATTDLITTVYATG